MTVRVIARPARGPTSGRPGGRSRATRSSTPSGKFLGYRGSAKDVTVEYERKLLDSRMAEYDALTGLANRHRMNRRLDCDPRRLQVSRGAPAR